MLTQLLRETANNVDRASENNSTYLWSASNVTMVREAADLIEWYEKRCVWYQQQLDKAASAVPVSTEE